MRAVARYEVVAIPFAAFQSCNIPLCSSLLDCQMSEGFQADPVSLRRTRDLLPLGCSDDAVQPSQHL